MTEALRGDPSLPTSGLDMAPTIAWYTANRDLLTSKIPMAVETHMPFKASGSERFALTPDEVSGIILRFPSQAIGRSRLNNEGSIVGKPTLYFSKGATPDNIITTSDESDALSPTAIIPSYIDNTRWRQTGTPSSDIWLFQLPETVDPVVRRIIHAEGLAHEFAHSFATQALYTENYRLKLPSGETVDGFEYLLTFAQTAEKYSPMSHYSSFYRKDGEEFKNNVAIEEELVETIAAHLLGFVFCADEKRRLDPLVDRPDIKDMIESFLGAEVVT